MKSACTLSPRADVGHVSIVLLKKLSNKLQLYWINQSQMCLKVDYVSIVLVKKKLLADEELQFYWIDQSKMYADVGHVSIVLVKNSWPMRSFNSIRSINGKFYQSRRADVSHVSIVLEKKTQ